MSDLIVKQIIEKRLNDNWELTPIAWDNLNFHPDDGISYIAPILTPVDSIRRGFGCLRTQYLLTIEIRVKKGEGGKNAESYCDLLKSFFVGFQSGNFNCIKGHSQRIGFNRQWFQKNLLLTCYYTSTI